MQAGKLRHRLEFQSPLIEDRDTTGDELGTYEPRFTVWGALESLTGRTFFEAHQINPEITGQVRVRYSDDTALIDSSWRIVHADKTYALTTPALNTEGRNKELTMFVSEMPVRHASHRN